MQSAVAAHGIPKHVLGLYLSESADISSPEDCIKVLLFAPLASERKSSRQHAFGRVFMDMRLKIVKNIVFNSTSKYSALCGTSDTGAGVGVFATRGGTSSRASTTGFTAFDESGNVALRHVLWIRKGFISKTMIRTLSQELQRSDDSESGTGQRGGGDEDVDEETREGTQPPPLKRRRTNPPGPRSDDIGLEVLRAIWKRGTDWFSTSRSDARKNFTATFGFLFHSKCCHNVEHFSRIRASPEICESIPLVDVSGHRERNRREEEIQKHIGAISGKYPEFVFSAQYLVKVQASSQNGSGRTGSRSDRMLRRRVNLLNAALHFLISYFQCDDSMTLLARSEHSLRLVFIVACTFSGIVEKCTVGLNDKQAMERIREECKNNGFLIPNDTTRQRFINEQVIQMTQEKFDALNCPDERDDSDGSQTPQDCNGIASDDEDVALVL